MRKAALTLELWTGLLMFGLLAGCAGYRAPSISVAEAVFVERTEEAILLNVAIDLMNPNDEPLELRRFDYRFSIDGVSAYSGARAAEATLGAGEVKRLILPAVIRLDEATWRVGAAPGEAEWSISGVLLYITPGRIAEVLLDTGVRKPQAHFAGSGRVALDAGPGEP